MLNSSVFSTLLTKLTPDFSAETSSKRACTEGLVVQKQKTKDVKIAKRSCRMTEDAV
jgi:hypothetical protein